ncbi:MAG: lysophospholipid acyltransferase family protein [Rhodobacteraceae bacterium]|nr:lysophospholipid acyltransferase family protein [Paracoccaceae bacterium]
MIRRSDYIVDLTIRNSLWVLQRFPYERRIPLAGHLMKHLVAPFTDMHHRITSNIDLALPELTKEARNRIRTRCLDNFGRLFSEFYSFPEFHRRAAGFSVIGPGCDALCRARRRGQPVILISGHFGNFHACPAALRARSERVAVMYQHMKNRHFDRHYVKVLEDIGDPAFARGRRGTIGFIRHLRSGGIVAALNDQHDAAGTVLDFMGLPARTNLALAKIAMDHDALMLPSYGIRKADGLEFDVLFEAPIPHTDPESMTQALNDSLERQVRAHPEQWYWVHRRWKNVA